MNRDSCVFLTFLFFFPSSKASLY
uniref:Uncharacterized protein n=1 Tax=Rhizophora mucronata TaxID=61149 RepID=A0A2P2R485_RHIMU